MVEKHRETGKSDAPTRECLRGARAGAGKEGGGGCHCWKFWGDHGTGKKDVLTRIHTDRFPIATAARTAKTGLAIGLVYGLAQDAVGAMRGRRPGYVDFLLGRGRGGKKEDITT